METRNWKRRQQTPFCFKILQCADLLTQIFHLLTLHDLCYKMQVNKFFKSFIGDIVWKRFQNILPKPLPRKMKRTILKKCSKWGNDLSWPNIKVLKNIYHSNWRIHEYGSWIGTSENIQKLAQTFSLCTTLESKILAVSHLTYKDWQHLSHNRVHLLSDVIWFELGMDLYPEFLQERAYGNFLIHFVAQGQKIKWLKLLISTYHQDPNVKGNNERTVLSFALRPCSSQPKRAIIKYLFNHGADTMININGNSIFDEIHRWIHLRELLYTHQQKNHKRKQM